MRVTEKLAVTLEPHRDLLRCVFYGSIAVEAMCFLGYLMDHGDIYGAATIATPWIRDGIRAVHAIAVKVRGSMQP